MQPLIQETMHEILLSSLNHDFGIRCTALNWFRSYLSNRKYVLTDDQKSTETSLKRQLLVLETWGHETRTRWL